MLTPLHLAIKYQNEEATRILLHHHALVDTGGQAGATPLQFAINAYRESKKIQFFKLLLEAKANVNNRDMRGDTPLMETVKDRWEHEADRIMIITTLLHYGANPNIIGFNGNTALHVAAARKFCSSQVIRILVGAGADMEVKDDSELCPFKIAIMGGCAENVMAFMALGRVMDETDRRLLECCSFEHFKPRILVGKYK